MRSCDLPIIIWLVKDVEGHNWLILTTSVIFHQYVVSGSFKNHKLISANINTAPTTSFGATVISNESLGNQLGNQFSSS